MKVYTLNHLHSCVVRVPMSSTDATTRLKAILLAQQPGVCVCVKREVGGISLFPAMRRRTMTFLLS